MQKETKKQNEPDLESLVDGRGKVLSNAQALLDEAKCLLDQGKYPRAFGLAHLASEELAKLLMIGSALLSTLRSDSFDWGRFGREFRDHRTKLKARGWIDFFATPVRDGEVVALDSRILDLEIETSNSLKNDSLYVGLKSGRFIAPSEAIDKALAEAECKKSKERLVYWRQFERESDKWIAAYKARQGK